MISSAIVLLSGVATSGQRPVTENPADRAVAVEMRGVTYHFTADVAVSIPRLNGALVPSKTDEIPVFDDKTSFTLRIDAAEISMPVASLANVLNANVFNAKDAPMKDISVRADKDRLKVKGKLHSKGDIPFETEGVLSATPDGKIRLHTEKLKALHLPVKGLMELLGLDLATLINTNKVKGIHIEKDDLILDPQEILPPPRIQGRVAQVFIRGNDVVQVFGDGSQPSTSRQAGNYMAYHGHQLRFGKLTMSDTDLTLIDMDPKDPFDFFLDHYKEQLVAGYSKITPASGLRTYMRDFNKLKVNTRGRGAK